MVKLWALTFKREFFSFGRGKQGKTGSTEGRQGKRELEQLFSYNTVSILYTLQ